MITKKIKNHGLRFVTSALALLLTIVLTFSATSCKDDEQTPTPIPEATLNIVQTAQATSDLSTLVTALTKYPDLVTLLSGTDKYTVFAPTNAAFTAFFAIIGKDINTVDESVLKKVLQYHVLAGAVKSTQLTTGDVTSALGEKIAVNVSSGVTLNGTTKVTTANVEASNGVVHIINQVLVPPSIASTLPKSIVETAQATTNLSTLVTVLTKYPDLITLLSGTNKYTVFAPTNAAFTAFLTAIGQTVNDVPENILKKVLQYHVVAGAVLSTQLTTGNVTSALGEAIAVDVSSGVKLNGNTTVTTANVIATNGVVHIIDKVLIPPTILPIVGTVVGPAYFNKNFTTLVAAVLAADPSILSTLLNSSNKTLFAPTNAAFIAAGITTLPAQETLNAVLKYHVIDSKVASGDIATGPSSGETLGGTIYLSKGSAGIFINGTSKVTTADIAASNGIVHVIDRTLLPPSQTIAEIASASSSFTQLVAALAKVPALLDAAGDEDSNLTVFAPTDAAFQALYTALNVDNIDELEDAIGNEKLANVLKHHIVGARRFSSDLVSGNVTTLNQDIIINVATLKITDANGSEPSSGLIPAWLNINATNGVIHAIDKVLIPDGIL